MQSYSDAQAAVDLSATISPQDEFQPIVPEALTGSDDEAPPVEQPTAAAAAAAVLPAAASAVAPLATTAGDGATIAGQVPVSSAPTLVAMPPSLPSGAEQPALTVVDQAVVPEVAAQPALEAVVVPAPQVVMMNPVPAAVEAAPEAGVVTPLGAAAVPAVVAPVASVGEVVVPPSTAEGSASAVALPGAAATPSSAPAVVVHAPTIPLVAGAPLTSPDVAPVAAGPPAAAVVTSLTAAAPVGNETVPIAVLTAEPTVPENSTAAGSVAQDLGEHCHCYRSFL